MLSNRSWTTVVVRGSRACEDAERSSVACSDLSRERGPFEAVESAFEAFIIIGGLAQGARVSRDKGRSVPPPAGAPQLVRSETTVANCESLRTPLAPGPRAVSRPRCVIIEFSTPPAAILHLFEVPHPEGPSTAPLAQKGSVHTVLDLLTRTNADSVRRCRRKPDEPEMNQSWSAHQRSSRSRVDDNVTFVDKVVRVGCVRPLSLFYSDASADGVEERSLVPRSRLHARLRRNGKMSHAFSCAQPSFIDL
ncbi:hypothetical protein EVAR_9005_1 [Eumeta japonica]|uniref:Uncharacterized protein n=1 Tax=Eumeta variegata TaxID=151549 RepID=A0A4C1WPB3_EUMVA|nr:hypothetical protein EVAR_9005_1 [Eumeta japonica]